MSHSAFRTVVVLLLGVAVVTPASAGPILNIVSGDGESWVGGAPIGGGSGTTVVINPHPAWQPAGDAQWVSYANTGYGGSQLAPPSGTNAIMTVTEQFNAGAGSVLNLKIWADDTARVRLNGIEMIAPNFSQGTCANGSIGCEPHEFGLLSLVLLSGGLQTLQFDVFQVGTGQDTWSNPFGILYQGTVELSSHTEQVPEPATLALVGLGLFGAATGARRRMRRES